jgi:hypothetical protein
VTAWAGAETPMSLDEAISVARSHPELKRALDGRARALFVEPAPVHRRAGEDEHVLFGLYDYESDRVLLALIDRHGRAVASVQESRARFQLNEAERDEAERLAAAYDDVRAFLRGRPMEPLTRLFFPHAGRVDPQHRFAIVFLRPTSRERAYAIVDLTKQRVTEVVSRAVFTGEQR